MADAADTTVPEAGPGRVPAGAQLLADLHGLLSAVKQIIAEQSDVQDNPAVKEHVADVSTKAEQLAGEINEKFKGEYPDLEPPGGGEKTKAEGDDDDEEETAPANSNDVGGPGKSFHLLVRRKGARGKVGRTKGQGDRDVPPADDPDDNQDEAENRKGILPGGSLEKVKACSEFLDDHSEHPGLDRTAKAAVMHHAKCMKEVVTDGTAAAPNADEVTGDTASAGDMVAKMAKQFNARLEALTKRISGAA